MKINVIGVPMYYGCDKAGVENGPDVLRENNIKGILSNENMHQIYDLGNIYVDEVKDEEKYSSHEKMKFLSSIIDVNTNLAHSVNTSLNSGCFPFVIGGDHSLGLGSLAGASKYFGDDFGVIWVDAHGDINTHETSPSGNVHGMPLAASMNIGHEKLTNIYFNGKKVDPKNVFILCARDLDEGELELIKELNINVWTTSVIKEQGVEATVNQLLDKIISSGINNYHLSFDIDTLDSDLVPGTGTPVSDGLSIQEVKTLLGSILDTRKIKSMDFVEFNPIIDKNNLTLNSCIEMLEFISQKL